MSKTDSQETKQHPLTTVRFDPKIKAWLEWERRKQELTSRDELLDGILRKYHIHCRQQDRNTPGID